MKKALSLLYPADSADAQVQSEMDCGFLEKLKMADLVTLSARRSTPWRSRNLELRRFLTSDAAVIRHRLDVLEDLLNNPELCSTFADVLPLIDDLIEIGSAKIEASDVTACLFAASELELYVDCTDSLYRALNNAKALNSAGLRDLFGLVGGIHDSAEYSSMKEKLSKMMASVRAIRSITIGVNLDAQLRSVEAGVVSVNSQPFRSGDLIDRLLRLDVADDGYRCITPLMPYGYNTSDPSAVALNSGINRAIDTIFRSSVQKWRPLIRRYLTENIGYLRGLGDEIRLLLALAHLVQRLRNLGLPMCKPQVCDMSDKTFRAEGLYNPHIALTLKEPFMEMVLNDFSFDDEGIIFILTGANQGGKSAITYAVGIAQALMQLGAFVPAKSAAISPVDHILTNFPAEEMASLGKGRLGEECARLRNTLEKATDCSLVLMDETLSSTSALEASYIAGEVIIGLSMIGCRCIFATHLHDLAQRVGELNRHPSARARIDNLVATLKDRESDQRSYKIVRTRPDGLSHARSIAEKYGVTLDSITKTRNRTGDEVISSGQ
jgi:DNA mismatch repair ATPase MutS